MEPMQPLPGLHDCLHDKSHFVTAVSDEDAARYLSDDPDVEQVTDLSGRYGDWYEDEARFSPADVGVDMWHVLDDVPAMDVIAQLRERDIDARPVYGFGFEGHWSLEPGGEAAHRQPLGHLAVPSVSVPSDAAAQEVGTLTSGTDDGAHVAVIDAGFSGVLPPSQHHASEISDADAMGVHGTLVLYLVGLVAPQARIDYVSVPLVTGGMGFLEEPHWRRSAAAAAGEVRCTDGLAIADAMRRLASGAVGGRAMCLNLSLGTYLAVMSRGTRSAEPVKPHEMELALDIANGHGVKVIAAAGNDDHDPDGQLFYPACRDDVVAVGAANLAGQSQLWDHGQRVDDCRSWWDYQAPGVDLCGAPFDESFALRWSGSSFAAPLVTGLCAAGETVAPSAGPTPEPIGYGDIPGLMYGVAGGGVEMTPTP